jgi:hypothetical protein
LSPILVRPVREQLEHDRVIRLLQAKYKRKFEVLINPGHEQAAPVLVGTSPWFPDVVLYSQERGRKLMGTVEVETAESVNNLEAMSQWKTFAQLKAAFHLYVPASSIDTARRLATELQVSIDELWAYSSFGDQIRFTLIQRSAAGEARARAAAASETKAGETKANETKASETKANEAKASETKASETKTRAAAKPIIPARPPAAAAPRSGANGRAKAGVTPTVRPAARRAGASAAAKPPRKPAPVRGYTKSAASRRVAAKKTTARGQKRK